MSKRKYSNKFKIHLMKLYLYDHWSYNDLHKKYHVNLLLLEEWHNLAQVWGLSIFKSQSRRHKFSSVFKLKVVKYYLNHHEGFLKAAARFKLSYSNVWQWTCKFKRRGSLGLKPAHKGECRIRRIHIKTEKDYKRENARLKAENKGLKLDKLILKTLAQVKLQTAKNTNGSFDPG